MKGGDNSAGAIIRPDSSSCTIIRVLWKQMRGMVWICLFQEFAENSAFVKRLITKFKRRNETTRVQRHQRLRLMVRID